MKKGILFAGIGVAFICYLMLRTSPAPEIEPDSVASAPSSLESSIPVAPVATPVSAAPASAVKDQKTPEARQDTVSEKAPSGRRFYPEKGFEWADEETLKRLESTAWISGYEMDPAAPDYDQTLQLNAKKMVERRDPLSTQRLKFRNGVYHGLIQSLNKVDTQPWVVELKQDTVDGKVMIVPLWLAWKKMWDKEGVPHPVVSVLDFRSPFVANEVYFGAIHFPVHAFGPIVDPAGSGECKEVILLQSVLVSLDSASMESISGRAYCRTGLEDLRPIGQFVLSM